MSNLPRSAVAAMCFISARLGQPSTTASGCRPAADVMARRLHEDAEAHVLLQCRRHISCAKLRIPPSTGITVPVM